MGKYFRELYECSVGNIKAELDQFKYALKADMKKATDIDTCMVASNRDLAIPKTKVNNLDVDKL